MEKLLKGYEGQTELDATAAASPCVVCRLPLPIRPKLESEVGEDWVCVRCGTKHHGVRLADAAAKHMANVRPFAKSQMGTSSADSVRRFPAGEQSAYEPQGTATKPSPGRGPVRCDHQTRLSQDIDAVIALGKHLSATPAGQSFLTGIKRHGARPYDESAEARLVEEYHDSLNQLESLVTSLEKGKPCDVGAAESITRDALVKATEDLDLFVRLGINPPTGSYPGRHSLHVAMLAASIGAHMGWDQKTLVDLGVGCLLHDIGMLQVPDDIYAADRTLDDREFSEIVRHPLHTFDLLAEHLNRVPLASRMVAYQMHERCNGSGYPRRRQSPLIHETAKVAAVADVYVALVSARPHRPALMPYHAVEHLLYGVKRGEFDSRAVRALLKALSLFPIGSYVSLTDGRPARVIRANSDEFRRPVVEAWLPDTLDGAPQIVDLSTESQIAIQVALPRLAVV